MASPYWKTVAPPIGWMAVIAAVSSIPGTSDTTSTSLLDWVSPSWQNALHVPVYALLSVLWLRALSISGWAMRSATITAILIASCYGITDEIHQYFVPGRTASVTDALVNVIGASLALPWALSRS